MYFGSQMYIRSQIYFNFASYQKWFSPHCKLIGSKFASDPIFLIILFLSEGHTHDKALWKASSTDGSLKDQLKSMAGSGYQTHVR